MRWPRPCPAEGGGDHGYFACGWSAKSVKSKAEVVVTPALGGTGGQRAKSVKAFLQRGLEILTNQISEGPWRSKSVLAALAAVVLGLGVWGSDLKNGPPPGATNNVVSNAPEITSPNPAVAPAGAHWNWSKPFPFYVRMGISYVAGFCIGWFFRKLTRLIMVVVTLIVALVAYGKLAGCDTSHAQEEVKRGGEWVQREVATTESYLRHVLPSATAGGTGIFLGFRRRGQAATPKPAT